MGKKQPVGGPVRASPRRTNVNAPASLNHKPRSNTTQSQSTKPTSTGPVSTSASTPASKPILLPSHNPNSTGTNTNTTARRAEQHQGQADQPRDGQRRKEDRPLQVQESSGGGRTGLEVRDGCSSEVSLSLRGWDGRLVRFGVWRDLREVRVMSFDRRLRLRSRYGYGGGQSEFDEKLSTTQNPGRAHSQLLPDFTIHLIQS
jgi:hypothetical protein